MPRWLAPVLVVVAVLLCPELTGSGHADLRRPWSPASVVDSLETEGEFLRAAHLVQERIDVLERRSGPADPELGAALDRLGCLLRERGDARQSVEVHRRALAIRRAVMEGGQRDLVQSLAHLARAEKDRGLYANSEAHYGQALTLADGRSAQLDTLRGEALNGLANLRRVRSRSVEAIELFREALRLRTRVLGNLSGAVAETRVDLALTLLQANRPSEACHEVEQALPVLRRSLGSHHPDLALALNTLALANVHEGRYAAAEPLLREAVGIYEAVRARALPGSDRDRFGLSAAAQLAGVLLLTGRESEAWREAERSLSPTLAEEFLDRWVGVVEPGPVRPDDPGARRVVPLERVQRSLPERTALVGWLDLNCAGERPVASWAYVIPKSGPLRWVRLPQPAGDALAVNLGGHLMQDADWPVPLPTSAEVDQMARKTWRERLAPILPYLGGVERVVALYSPWLNVSPLEACMDDSGTWSIDRLTFSYAPSASVFAWLRELAARDRPGPPETRPALLLGDPASNEDGVATVSDGPGEAAVALQGCPSSSALPRALAWRGSPRDAGPSSAQLPRLPGTRWEVTSLAALLPGATVLLGADASEARLRELARSGELRRFGTIHLATHSLRGRDTRLRDYSALVLARAPGNAASPAMPDEATDGLLFPEEIARLPLAADLVTLSGCGTRGTNIGSGFTGPSEAFLVAGARSVVASLWRVEDGATALLMRRFYENLTGRSEEPDGHARSPLPKPEALREAKRWLRDYRDPGGRLYSNPVYWSAFVLLGDPE